MTKSKSKVPVSLEYHYESPFKHQYNAELFSRDPETSNLPSMTVPDMSMSIKDIINRHSRGLPTGGQRVPIYEGEEDILDGVKWETLDLSERQAFIEARRDELLDMQRSYQERQETKRILDLAEQKEKEYQERKAKDQNTTTDQES